MSAVPDAIALLAADHRQVEAWFTELQSAASVRREEELAYGICEIIRRHMRMDTRVFYPAVLAATGDSYKCQAVLAEDQDISELIDEIESSSPAQESFFAKIHLLCMMFKHHVQREEKEHGVFNELRESGLDLSRLGRQLQQT